MKRLLSLVLTLMLWPQKGAGVEIPIGLSAPVYGDGKGLALTASPTASPMYGLTYHDPTSMELANADTSVGHVLGSSTSSVFPTNIYEKTLGVLPKGYGDSGLYADLSEATAYTINSLRQAFQIQRMLERDARGGTRYTEIVRSHFGVISPDARLQRPEYLGGGTTPVNVNPIAQTSATSITGGSSPLGNLAALS